MSSLSRKIKPSRNYLNLHEATHLVLKTMFPSEWVSNEFTHESPFRVELTKAEVLAEVDSINFKRNLIRYEISTKNGKKKPRSYSVLSEVSLSQYEKEQAAAKLFRKAWKKIRKQLIQKKLSIKARSTDDDSDKLYSQHDIATGVWNNRSRSIFYSGYVKINTDTKTVWGIFFIKKKDVEELCSNIEKIRKKNLNKVRNEYNDNDIEKLRSYVVRLSDYAKSNKHCSIHKGNLYVHINTETCKEFVDYCANTMKLEWKKDKDYKKHFQDYSLDGGTNTFLKPLGIAIDGHPPKKPSDMPDTNKMVEHVKAEIFKPHV